MTLEQWYFVSQILAALAVIATLVFVGLQVRQHTAALYRNEHNATMAQWTVIRMAIVQSRDLAEIMTSGLHGKSDLNAADQLRLEQFLGEQLWASFHVWDRTQRGVFHAGTFEATAGAYLPAILATKRGGAWWRSAGTTGFPPAFVSAVDAILATHAEASGGAKA